MNRHGSIIFSLLLVLVLTVLGAGLLLRSVNENKAATRTANSSQAFWLADAGLQRVKYNKNSINCLEMHRQDTGAVCTDCTCGGMTKTYTATIANIGDIDATLNSSNTTVQSTGSVPSRLNTKKVTRSVQGTFAASAVAAPMFGHGAFAKGTFFMKDTALVDSYNSTLGDYNAATANSNANVGTNGTTAGIITMGNGTTIKGNVSTGVGGTVSASGATITGSQSHLNNVSMPDVVVPPSLTSLIPKTAISSAAGTTTINAGSWKYPSITLTDTANLVISGNVTLYLTGNLSTQSGAKITVNNGSSLTIYIDGTAVLKDTSAINNLSKNPSKLLIYSTFSSGTGFKIADTTTFYGGVYMPNADYTANDSSQIMGALVAKVISMGDKNKIHYDESLANLVNPFSSGGVGVVSGAVTNWQEF